MGKYLFILGAHILIVSCDLIGIGLLTFIIYLFGKLMEYISNKRKNLEWINTCIACICIVLTAGIILIGFKILCTLAPYIFIITIFMTILGLFIIFISYIIDLIKKYLHYKK